MKHRSGRHVARWARLVLRARGMSLAACFVASCAVSPSAPETHTGIGILFIGNSLTSANDLPSLVARIARLAGAPVTTVSAAVPNFALIDHVTQGQALRRIAEGGWAAVVLQQGPTPAGVCRDTLVLATRELDARIRLTGARTATLMTWPYAGYPDAFAWVHESARRASDSVQGVFLPAGDAWLNAWRRSPSLALYGPDGYHPSALGSLLAALVTYEGITGFDVRTLALETEFSSLTNAATLRVLQDAAHEAVMAAHGEKAASDFTPVSAKAAC